MHRQRLEDIRKAMSRSGHDHDGSELIRYIDDLHEIIKVADACMQLAEGQHCDTESYNAVRPKATAL